MSAELRPCPFCGGSARQESYIVEACVFCTACDARVRAYHEAKEDTGDAKSAQVWNTRAPQWLPIESLVSDELVLTWHDFGCINQNKASPDYGKTGYARIQQRFGGRLFPSEACETGFVSHWQPLPTAPELSQ